MIQKKTRFLWLFVVILFMVAALSYPAYQQIRAWRASAMAMEAEEMLNSPETISRAWELAHAAKALNPEDLVIARILARVYSEVDPQSAHPLWQKVVELSGGAPEDRLELARSYLQASLWQEFASEIDAQREIGLHPQQLDYLEVLAASRRGNYEQALQMAAALVAKDNAPHEADGLYFQLTRIFQEPEVRRAGIDHMWSIAKRGGPRQEEALKTLAQLPDLEVSDIKLLITTIDQLDDDSRERLLLAEELRLRLPDAAQSSIYNRVRTLFDLDDPSEIAALGRWLNSHGLHYYTRRAIPTETAMTRQDLFLIHADALALSGEWDAIFALLDQPRTPIEDYLRESFRMRTLVETGDLRRARLAWDRALLAAARESPKLYYLARQAQKLELHEFEIAALRRVAESPTMRKAALSDLIAVLQRQGKTGELHQALLDYRRYFPDDTDARNDARYVSFLLGETTAEGLAEAQDLLEAQPNFLAYRMTVVLGLLTEDRSAEALDLLIELPVDWFEVRDRWRLLAATALHREGFQADAQKLAAQIDPSNLLPEERQFLEAIRG